MKIMAVDLGAARTGVAVCDFSETLASPIGVIHDKNPERILEKVAKIAAEHVVERIVVGYPKHMNNSVGERAILSEEFAKTLATQTGLPTILWDERGTTVTAIGYLNETNTRGKKRKNVVDAVAATIILENYLMWRKNNLAKSEKEM